MSDSGLLTDPNGATKLATTFLEKLQLVSAWNAQVVERALHSAGAKSAASSTSDRTIDRAEPCFITNVSAYTHQQAHWINTTRGNDDKHADAIALVETFLRSQGIVDHIFSLDDACNLANMDASLHIAMDKYAMFAITCSHNCLDKYIEIITAENEQWISHLANGKLYTRDLKLLHSSVRFAEYELVVLQPHHFLPDNALLPLYSRQHGREVIGLKHYKMAVDHVLREQTGDDQDSNRFPPFRFIGIRNQIGRTINPFLVILGAEIKFRRYLAADGPRLPPVYDSLMQKTIQVADLLYFLPEERQSAFRDPIVIDMPAFYSPVDFVDTEMGSRIDGDASGGSTARQQRRAAAGGGGTRPANAGYWRHMLSGRDLELNNDDLDVLREIQESNRAAASSHGQSLDQVEMGREAIKVLGSCISS